MSKHEKLVLFTAQAYLDKAIEEGITREDFHKRIAVAIEAWKMMRRFSQEEAKEMQKLGDDEYMQRIRKTEIAYVVYALELLKLWANDSDYMASSINISKKRLRMGRGVFVMGMLDLKRRDKEKHKELKQIIDVSVVTAKQFYEYSKRRLKDD